MSAPLHSHHITTGGRDQSREPCPILADSISFGQFLRGARERAGVSLERIADETKIPRRHLESLERGDLAAVPEGPYRRGEVIAYARVIGLDRNLALAHLERAFPQTERPGKSRPSSTRSYLPSDGLESWLAMFAAAGMLTAAALLAASLSDDGGRALSDGTGGGPVAPATMPQATAVPPSSVGSDVTFTRAEPPLAKSAPATVPAEPAADRVAIDRRLVIVSEPSGARVTVDGIGRGFTPLAIDNLPAGARRIRVTKVGYAAVERIVQVPSSGATTVNLLLGASDTPSPNAQPR